MRHHYKMKNATLHSFLRNPGSVEERLARGKQLRQQNPRSSLADFAVQSNRSLPVDVLRQQAKSRVTELIPIRHARMATDPFAFFRGGAALMAHDLSTLPSPTINVQLCGDMHVSNFGFFSSSERRLVFGINDFDETLPGHFDWDLKRLTASAMIAAESLGQDRVYGAKIVRLITRTYRTRLAHYAHTPYIELARSFIDEDSLLAEGKRIDANALDFVKRHIAKARKNTNLGVIGKLTTDTPTGRRLIENPPLVSRYTHTVNGRPIADGLNDCLQSYASSLLSDRQHTLAQYRLVDFARKVVGVGSVGTRCWIIYMEGLDEHDPLFLQYKEALPSVLSPYFPDRSFRSQGERVVHGQRLIQGAPDLFLGYGKNPEAQFYVRQLRDMKGGIAFGEGGIGPDEFPDYARLFGWALANAHARSGDPAILAGYCGQGEQLDDAMARFAECYSTQNQADYDTFLKAIRAGKLACAAENF